MGHGSPYGRSHRSWVTWVMCVIGHVSHGSLGHGNVCHGSRGPWVTWPWLHGSRVAWVMCVMGHVSHGSNWSCVLLVTWVMGHMGHGKVCHGSCGSNHK